MPSLNSLEKVLSAIPVLIELAKRNHYVLPLKTIQKILNLRNRKEAISIINHLCMITNNVLGSPLHFFNIYYEKEFVFFDPRGFLNLDKINLPLNEKDLQNLRTLLSEDKKLWNHLIKKINLDILLETSQSWQESILTLIEKAIQQTQQVWFNYKKLNASTVELKKIIPLKIQKYYDNHYVIGYDLQSKDDIQYKFYRIDRILEIVKIVKNQRKLEVKLDQIDSLTKILKNINAPQEEIIFAYEPTIEINLQNYITFFQLPESIEFENKKWLIGKIKTKFPNYFLEVAIYFAKWIYVIKPTIYNEKIKEHYKKILTKLQDKS